MHFLNDWERTQPLVLNGDLDLVVSSRQNLSLVAEALKAAGNKDYTIICA